MSDERKNESVTSAKEHIEEAASQLYEEGRRKVNEGLETASEFEQSIEKHISNISSKIRSKPLTSVLMAALIGYIWAKLK